MDIQRFANHFWFAMFQHALYPLAAFHIGRIAFSHFQSMTHSVDPHLVLANISAKKNVNLFDSVQFLRLECTIVCKKVIIILFYLRHFPNDDRTICTTRNDKFAAWTESAGNNAGCVRNSTTDLNCRLIIPQLYAKINEQNEI